MIKRIVINLLPLIALAGHKPRDWQTGTLINSEIVNYYAGSVGTGNTTVYPGGGGLSGTRNTTSRAVYGAFRTYTIETDTHIYAAAERPVWTRPLDVTINARVKFAIEDSPWNRGVQRYIFLIGESGKERKLTIVSKTLKQPWITENPK
jgi:hypothetical protein